MKTKQVTRFFQVVVFLCLSVFFVFGASVHHDHEVVGLDTGRCDHTMMRQLLYQTHPAARPENNPAHEKLEAFTRTFIAEKELMRSSKIYRAQAVTTKTIPIVFHIIHQNGEENISDAQVLSALQAINEDFSDTNPNRGDLLPVFQGLEGGTSFVFKLPTKDPDGNPTTGINRHYDPNFPTGDDIAMKELYGWPREMYMNIYVVNSASGGNSSGFSYYPADVDDWPAYDGIVLSHWAVGTTGTAIPSHYRLISHEAGHWANLKHTWGDRFQYGSKAACRDDDDVADTPNCVGFWGGDPDGGPDGCNTSHESCNSLDMIQNHMDYAFCPIVFTLGQADRMEAALNSSVAQRNNLWPPANLIAVGLEGDIPSLDDMYVSDISLVQLKQGKNYYARASVTILDEFGSPVSGATVYVDWSGLVTGAASGVTGADGVAVIDSPKTRTSTGTFTITITDVSSGAYIYNSALNNETSDSISF